MNLIIVIDAFSKYILGINLNGKKGIIIMPELKICWFPITRVCSFEYTQLVKKKNIILRLTF